MYLISNKPLWSLLVFCFFLLTGCGFHTTKYYPLWWPHSVSEEFQAQLDEGNRLFMEGDYASAETVFKELQQSANPAVIHQARYGLACSRFMLAKDREEYLDAVEALELWQRNSPADLGQGDPRMVLAFFSKVVPQAPEDGPKGAASEQVHVLVRFLDHEQQMEDLENRITELKRQIGDLERQKGSMKAMEAAMKAMEDAMKASEDTARTMEAELLELRQQIKTFETIDQEIQEKKQGISSQ